jgi:hypothetical protein
MRFDRQFRRHGIADFCSRCDSYQVGHRTNIVPGNEVSEGAHSLIFEHANSGGNQ